MRNVRVELADIRDSVKTAIKSLEMQIKRMVDRGETNANPYLGQLRIELQKRRNQLAALPAETASVETAADWWDNLTPEQKKQYVKDHPNSKYAKDSAKGKPAAKTSPSDSNSNVAKAAKTLADHVAKNRAAVDEYNKLLRRWKSAEGRTKKNLENQLYELEQTPAIKKALDLHDAKKAAEKDTKSAPKPVAKPAAKTVPKTTSDIGANAEKIKQLEEQWRKLSHEEREGGKGMLIERKIRALTSDGKRILPPESNSNYERKARILEEIQKWKDRLRHSKNFDIKARLRQRIEELQEELQQI